MADLPCMPFWTDAYLADTQHLTTEEHGAYLLLLFQAWRSHDCSLADDDDMLSRQAGVSMAKWKGMKSIVMAFWTLDKRRKRWVQKRLKIEREKASVKKAKARDSAASRWKGKEKGDANALRTQCYPEPKPKHSFSKSASAQKKSTRQSIMEVFNDA
ncbi:DUF1376 domain-containing protein [Rhizobium sp. Root1204]|uniref:DUF1376 domain-containing protein n=1 Tax=Rhizobium sp. Root1204 TaxID=1736428 RepID=UPI000714E40C|nr:DUF1376 domain-containing protein [Rhizobium sp. Root1204]KQV31126.1 hypothetical protein ASC96_08010 [Rhizobium sp. Root1204]